MILKKADLREYFIDDDFPLIEEYSYLLKNRWGGYSNEVAYQSFVEKHSDVVKKFHNCFVCIWD